MNNTDLVFESDLLKYYEQAGIDIDLECINELRKIGDITTKSNAELRKIANNLGTGISLIALGVLLGINSKKALKKTLIKHTKGNIKAYNKNYDENVELDEKYTKVLNKVLNNANKDLKKLNKSISLNQQQKVGQIFKEMYKSVQSGNVTYNNAFKDACDKLIENKISFKDSLGRERRAEAVVRQELQYQLHEQANSNYEMIAKDLGTTGWQITHSSRCRPTHEIIDGEKFTNEQWAKLSYLREDYNCDHDAQPIFYETEKNMYSKSELERDYNRTYTYKGKEYKSYDAQQIQRQLERNIRYAKEEIVKARQTPEVDINKYKAKLNKAQQNMRSFINETGLERDSLRERFAGYN